MICTKCGGTGRVRRSFLGLFSWYARCPRCRQVVTLSSFDRDEVIYRDPGPQAAVGSTPATAAPGEWKPGGGRGGGAGASASWDEPAREGSAGHAGGDELPLIVDPFAGSDETRGGEAPGSSASGSAANAGEERGEDGNRGGDSQEAEDAGADGAQDGGTSY
jgi:hypothetical protein